MDAGWTSYTDDIPKLIKAFKKSSVVISAWYNDKLVGLVRAMTDKETILFIQDLLIINTFKRKGIASTLLKIVMNKYQVRQTILQTDKLDGVLNAFYQKLGFIKSEDLETQSYILCR
jgi:ribosomal protein S18 acetylase RimI-like enzyme